MAEVTVSTVAPIPEEQTLSEESSINFSEPVVFKIKSTKMTIEMAPPAFPVDLFAPQFVQMPSKQELTTSDLAGYSQQLQTIEAILYVKSINSESVMFPQNQQQFMQVCTKLGDIGVKRVRQQYLKNFSPTGDDDIEVIKKNLP